MKNNKIKLILVISAVLLVVFNAFSFFVTDRNIEATVEEAIANQALDTAKEVSARIDIDTYKKFLENREKNDYYWKLNNELNSIRENIGALYVYILEINNPNVSYVMIDGVPKDQQGPGIGWICTLPKEQVSQAFYKGTPYTSNIIHDPGHGKYLSVGAPIMDENDEIIGFLGIDISTDKINAINDSVQENNIVIFLINSVFLLIVIISSYLIQSWYQREVAKEVENTEDTYQGEIQTLLSSVSSLRHDYSNHIQVIHGLLTIGETEKALQYVNSLSNEVQLIESINSTIEHPGLGILLKSKKIAAQNHQIALETKIAQNSYQSIKTTDMIKILSNLIDNAIDATKELPEQMRRISILCDVNEEETHYIFEITNTGPKIGCNKEIFKQGFSTKPAEDGKVRGQGLFIVKEVVRKYNGKISLHSTDENITTATVVIPIR
ncbi:GHKL domain-containing protein [Ureibacillus aquaedulcis]|uniref:GHKL domain-containing protein n=1 Tax=Ureibacillus aquaedulcis TaxID=3058421 RepID=A0ABT8GTN4_9BACL|nr:GHKL domain-containing protein [Ureibacillus sp. BA0131]MDN4494773.1 GHKL domain-containing protein [Ureibacillus sp. BA0131]